MIKTLHKNLGPLGRPRYKWIDIMAHNRHLFEEVKKSCKEHDFKIIADWGYDETGIPHQFIVEPRDEGSDALFVLTWSHLIDADTYHAQKKTAYPADWITHVLYHVTKSSENSLGMTLTFLVLLIAGPVVLDAFYPNPDFWWVSLVGMIGMWILVGLRVYDDARVSRHERKMRALED